MHFEQFQVILFIIYVATDKIIYHYILYLLYGLIHQIYLHNPFNYYVEF